MKGKVAFHRSLSASDKGIPKDKWIPRRLWNVVTKYVPMPCMDVVFQQKDGSLLFGYRRISPYRNLWSLIGGRILAGERLEESADRIAQEYGLRFEELYLIGVFPVSFRTRSDIVVAVAARELSGKEVVDGKEFSSMEWRKEAPKGLARNYGLMLQKWRHISRFKKTLESSRIP